MSVVRCAECGECSSEVVAYCVECKKVLCRRCVGRLHVPECPKAAKHSIERIDVEHQDVQRITNIILHTSICIGLIFSLWNFPVDKNFYKMENICPAVGQGRWWLAHLDVNVYYYFKTSISTYCDVEDSFWRLLMDGWIRGVVTTSDSLLILLSTLPKALLFKVASVTLLMPLLAGIYAVLAFLLMHLVACMEDVLHDAYDRVCDCFGLQRASAVNTFRIIQFICNLPWRVASVGAIFQDRWSKTIRTLRQVALAFGVAGALRLVVRYFGMRFMPKLWQLLTPNVNNWQLMFEPVMFFYLARLLGWMDVKFNKLVPKKLALPEPPLTLVRDRPMQDYLEGFNYHYERVSRRLNHYKKQAENLVKVIVDDVFNGVVVFRLACIALPVLATIVRSFLSLVGFGGLLERHAYHFYEATGFRQGAENMYLSDRLVSLSYWLSVSQFGNIDTLRELTSMSFAWEGIWRILVPIALYVVYGKWQKLVMKQGKEFKAEWEGPADARWKCGAYQRCYHEYGSFWNTVNIDEWEPAPAMLKNSRPRLFSKERRASLVAKRDSADSISSGDSAKLNGNPTSNQCAGGA